MPWHRKKDVKRDETLWGKTKNFEIHRSPKGKPNYEDACIVMTYGRF